MSDSSAKPRFLIRLSDGSELSVASVDALTDHIVSGSVLPDTSLFDTSTGAWEVARDSVVLRFLLEEMREHGTEIPDVWDRPEDTESSGDLLDLEFTLTETPDPIDPDSVDDFVFPTVDGTDDQPDDADDLISPLDFGDLSSSTMSEGLPEDDTAAPAEGSYDRGAPDPAPPSVDAESGSRPSGRAAAPESERSPAPVRSPPPVESPKTSPPPPARTGPNRSGARSERSGRSVVIATAVVLGLAVAGLLFALAWGGGAGDGAGSSTAGDGSQSIPGSADSAMPPFPAPPPDLAEAVHLSEVRFGDRMETTVDSIRSAFGLMDGPPDPWLGGYYLANAGEFAEIREFWVSYGLAIEEIRLLDRAHFLAMANSESREYVTGEDQADRLEAYLLGRYEAAAPAKEERYRRLVRVSVRAVALHDFLVDYEQELRYTPAVGSAVPGDPVLEVAADDPIVRQGLAAQLDALFVELDGARRGGPPALGGLPAEIFSGFESF